jgi:hypothetical protein
MERSPSWEANMYSSSQEILLNLPCSQELATDPYPKSDESTPQLPNLFP